MIKKRKPSLSAQKTGDGFIGRLFAQTKLPAHVTEEQDWYMDTPDVRLTRVFTVVLILHVVAVGGILAFKMVEKASTPAVVASTETVLPEAGTAKAAPAAAVTPQESATPAPQPAAAGTEAPAATKGTGTAQLVNHPSAEGYGEYTVGDKETLASIAQKLNVSESTIREANLIDGDQNLYPGRVLFVPVAKATPAPARPSSPAAPVVAQETKKAAGSAVAAATSNLPPAPRETAAKAAPKTAVGRASTHQVQKGETLYSISRRLGVKVQDLMAANGIGNADKLQIGQTLKVPQN